jgi:hypothetical protein
VKGNVVHTVLSKAFATFSQKPNPATDVYMNSEAGPSPIFTAPGGGEGTVFHNASRSFRPIFPKVRTAMEAAIRAMWGLN